MAVDFSLGSTAAYAAVLWLCYTVYGVIWRLYFSPLAKYPGPKLAAATRWYEFYYDVVLRNRFSWEIQRLHDIYGPIIRISPEEIHIRDPDFYDELMTTSARPRDKTEAFAGRSGRDSIFGTVPHDHHRLRRGALNPFFSKKSILAIEPLIQEKVDKLCMNLSTYAETKQPVELGLAYMAVTLDIISHYAFGESYGLTDRPGFSPLWKDVVTGTMESVALVRNLPWLPDLLKSLPHPVTRLVDQGLAFYLNMEREMRVKVFSMVEGKRDLAKTPSATEKGAAHKSIFETLIDSDLPSEEKTVDRLNEEGFSLILAGGDTSSQTLAMMSFHLLDNPGLLERLKVELCEAIPDPKSPAKWQKLEKLPFLRACITEGLRVNAIATSRSVRAAPKETLHYKGWTIEPGTPIGMNTHFTHLNPNIFPDPSKFDPDRWLRAEEAGETKQLEKYFNPFGKGTRNCIGINLANAEIYMIIANVFRRLELELFETAREDITIVCDAFIGHPKKDSKGVRVKVLKGWKV